MYHNVCCTLQIHLISEATTRQVTYVISTVSCSTRARCVHMIWMCIETIRTRQSLTFKPSTKVECNCVRLVRMSISRGDVCANGVDLNIVPSQHINPLEAPTHPCPKHAPRLGGFDTAVRELLQEEPHSLYDRYPSPHPTVEDYYIQT